MMMETLQEVTKKFEQSEVFIVKGRTGSNANGVSESVESNDLDARRCQIFMVGQQRKCPYQRVRTFRKQKQSLCFMYLANTCSI